MCNQIRLQKTWFEVVPVGEGAHRNLMLEQSPGAGRPNTPAACTTRFFKQSVNSRRAHLQKLLSNFIGQEKVSTPFQRGNALS